MSLSDDLRYLIEYDISRVKRILRDLVAELPQSVEARILLGDTHLRALEFDSAVEQYRAGLEVQPKSRLLVAKLALCGIYTGRYADALQGFEALHRAGRDEQALGLAGIMLHRVGRLDEAQERLARLNGAAAADSPFLLLGLQAEIRALRAAGKGVAADAVSARLMAMLDAGHGEVASELHQRTSSYDYHEWSGLADKARLAALLGRRGAGVRFPESFVMPAERAGLAAFGHEAGVFVIKPLGGQGGQGIRLTASLDEALAAEDAVVQRYIDPPFLVQGRKAHLRIYCLITSTDPLRCYVHENGVVRFAPREYARGEGWLERSDMHVTNTALHRKNPLLVMSQDAAVEDVGHVWSLRAYLQRAPSWVFGEIARLVGRFVLALREDGVFARQAASGEASSFGAKLFGLDVLLDGDGQPWLIEIQRSPAWSGPPLVKRINGGVAEAMARMVSSALGVGDDVGAMARRELEVEATERGGFRRIVEQASGEAGEIVI